MKENGMNKLIELLDEYDSVQYHKINHKIENGDVYRNVGGTDGWHQVWRYRKSFGFIKWLVDNDKIDLKAGPLYGFQPIMSNRQPFTLYETLLMLLSIQDNPIEFLISILR